MSSYLQHGSRHRRFPLGSDPLPSHTDFAFLGFNQGGGDSGHNQAATTAIELDVDWYTFYSSDTDGYIFGTSTLPTGDPHNTAGDKWLQLYRPGVYDVMAAIQFESGTFDRFAYLTSETGINVIQSAAAGTPLSKAGYGTSSTGMGGHTEVLLLFETIFIPSDSAPGAVKCVVGQTSGSNKNIVLGTLGCTYHAGDDFGAQADFKVYP
jgi:hypothetical protein